MKYSIMSNTLLFVLIMVTLLPGQTVRWLYEYAWLGHDEAVSIVYASDNTICTAGNSWDLYTNTDLMLVGHDTLGNILWGPVFYTTENIDIVADMVCGQEDIFYLCATVDIYDVLPNTDEDMLISAISSTGSSLWNYRYNAGMAEARAIMQDRSGNVYACGTHIVYRFVPTYFINPEFLVLSFTDSGTLRWRYLRDNGGNEYENPDCANSITGGGDDNIYAAGYISSGEGEQYKDFAVVKLDTSGQERWTYIYNGPANNADVANSIISCGTRKLFVAGSSTGISTGGDFTVICIDTSAQEQWTYRYNGPVSGNDEANKIIMGDDGNLYAGGHSGGDLIIISLDTLGNERWIYRKTGGIAKSLTYGQNRIYVCDAGGFGVVCLDTSGNELWCYTCGGQANDIVYGLDNNTYAAGEDGAFLVVSLRDTTSVVKVEETEHLSPQNKKLDLVVLSPVKNDLWFFISSPAVGNGNLIVYNTVGQRVFSTKIDILSGVTKHYLTLPENLPCGIYFLKAEMPNRTAVEKFVIVR